MKIHKLIYVLLSTSVVIFCIVVTQQNTYAYSNGISGRTGSPGVFGATCESCHKVNSFQNSTIFSISNDIPLNGYIPGNIYNFTVNINSVRKKTGFNVRVESGPEGEIAGTLNNLDSLSTIQELELTHTINNLITDNQKNINFTWIAPQVSDSVTLFASIATFTDQINEIDTLNFLNLTLKRSQTISQIKTEDLKFEMNYLVVDKIVKLSSTRDFLINYLSLYSQLGNVIFNERNVSSDSNFNFEINCQNLQSGIYFLKVDFDSSNTKTIKIVIP